MSGFNQVVEGRHGRFVVNRHDQFVGRSMIEYGEFSRGESDLFSELVTPDMIVIEVGANVGAHTVQLSRLARKVIAFEPQRLAFQALCGNLALNSCANVQAHQMAVAYRPGSVSVVQLDPDAPNNVGGLSLKAEVPGVAERVPVTTLAHMPCDFLKLDCEGMELDVLKGCEAMLRTKRPIVYAECDRPDQRDVVPAFLLDLGYTVYHHRPPLYSPENHSGNQVNVWGANYVSDNLLCTVGPLSPVQIDRFSLELVSVATTVHG